MATREIVRIDESLCDGCGDCVPSCAEGAIQVVDGKARLVSDVYCDGLGACLGHCPRGAITIVERDAAAFDAAAVEARLAARPAPPEPARVPAPPHGGGCPGSRPQAFGGAPFVPFAEPRGDAAAPAPSRLRHWPVQLHLVPPTAPFFAGADVVLAADCVAFAMGDFHQRFLTGRSLAIACPKLDSQQEIYLQKLVAMIDDAAIASLTVVVMEVPCCSGLVRLAQEAVARAGRPVPLRVAVVGTRGEVLVEQQVATA